MPSGKKNKANQKSDNSNNSVQTTNNNNDDSNNTTKNNNKETTNKHNHEHHISWRRRRNTHGGAAAATAACAPDRKAERNISRGTRLTSSRGLRSKATTEAEISTHPAQSARPGPSPGGGYRASSTPGGAEAWSPLWRVTGPTTSKDRRKRASPTTPGTLVRRLGRALPCKRDGAALATRAPACHAAPTTHTLPTSRQPRRRMPGDLAQQAAESKQRRSMPTNANTEVQTHDVQSTTTDATGVSADHMQRISMKSKAASMVRGHRGDSSGCAQPRGVGHVRRGNSSSSASTVNRPPFAGRRHRRSIVGRGSWVVGVIFVGRRRGPPVAGYRSSSPVVHRPSSIARRRHDRCASSDDDIVHRSPSSSIARRSPFAVVGRRSSSAMGRRRRRSVAGRRSPSSVVHIVVVANVVTVVRQRHGRSVVGRHRPSCVVVRRLTTWWTGRRSSCLSVVRRRCHRCSPSSSVVVYRSTTSSTGRKSPVVVAHCPIARRPLPVVVMTVARRWSTSSSIGRRSPVAVIVAGPSSVGDVVGRSPVTGLRCRSLISVVRRRHRRSAAGRLSPVAGLVPLAGVPSAGRLLDGDGCTALSFKESGGVNYDLLAELDPAGTEMPIWTRFLARPFDALLGGRRRSPASSIDNIVDRSSVAVFVRRPPLS